VLRLNREAELHPNDERWIERTIRSHWPFVATPLRLQFKADPPQRKRRNALSTSGDAGRVMKMPHRKWTELQKPVWRRKAFIAEKTQENRKKMEARQVILRRKAWQGSSGADSGSGATP